MSDNRQYFICPFDSRRHSWRIWCSHRRYWIFIWGHDIFQEFMVVNIFVKSEERSIFLEEAKYKHTVSILTACLNEAGNIGKWLDQISNIITYEKLYSIVEVVIVDDGSTDGTVEEVLKRVESYPIPLRMIQRNVKMGTLNAQIIGSRRCLSEYVLTMDCDLQHPVDFIPDFIEKLDEDPDIVIGSRYMPGGYNSWPAYRGFVSRTATLLSHALITSSRKVKDPLSGYFLIKRDMISKLKPYTGMYKPLLFAIAVAGNPKMVEIPIRMEERDTGESKIVTNPVKVVLKYLREILVFFKYTHQ